MSRKILLADDSVTIRKVVELTFMEENYDLTSVADGREALRQLDELVPDLVIADIHMGDVGGFEVCRESKKTRPHVPVLLLVGTFEPFDPANVEECGADAYLKKPFDSQDLLNEVGKLIKEEERSDESDEPMEEESSAVVDTPAVALISPEPVPEEPVPDEPISEPAAEEHVATPGIEASTSERPAVGLSDQDVERIARRVVELLSADSVRDVAWEVVPDMAEVVVKERLRELESQVD